MTRSPEDADDVTSEAADEIVNRRKYNPKRGAFPPFVKMVVRNAAILFYRRAGRTQRDVDAMGPFVMQTVTRAGVTHATELVAESAIREAELKVMLTEVLKHVSPENREAFGMRLAGYSRAEIARKVLVRGRHISPQAWGDRLRPIEDRVMEELDLRLRNSP